jgi:hypothetical protein
MKKMQNQIRLKIANKNLKNDFKLLLFIQFYYLITSNINTISTTYLLTKIVLITQLPIFPKLHQPNLITNSNHLITNPPVNKFDNPIHE